MVCQEARKEARFGDFLEGRLNNYLQISTKWAAYLSPPKSQILPMEVYHISPINRPKRGHLHRLFSELFGGLLLISEHHARGGHCGEFGQT